MTLLPLELSIMGHTDRTLYISRDGACGTVFRQVSTTFLGLCALSCQCKSMCNLDCEWLLIEYLIAYACSRQDPWYIRWPSTQCTNYYSWRFPHINTLTSHPWHANSLSTPQRVRHSHCTSKGTTNDQILRMIWELNPDVSNRNCSSISTPSTTVSMWAVLLLVFGSNDKNTRTLQLTNILLSTNQMTTTSSTLPACTTHIFFGLFFPKTWWKQTLSLWIMKQHMQSVRTHLEEHAMLSDC